MSFALGVEFDVIVPGKAVVSPTFSDAPSEATLDAEVKAVVVDLVVDLGVLGVVELLTEAKINKHDK